MRGLDCGDNSCLFAEQRGGMRTNGGCQCLVILEEGGGPDSRNLACEIRRAFKAAHTTALTRAAELADAASARHTALLGDELLSEDDARHDAAADALGELANDLRALAKEEA